VLDGFPRTIGQAEALDRCLEARDAALDAACCLRERGRLVVVDAVGPPEVIGERILNGVAALVSSHRPTGRR
jgi:adenylate kinase family enzyme